jgi:hypothetical protein
MIETSSTPPYLSARKFYKRHHYVQEAVLRDYYAPGDHMHIYSKRLKSPQKQDHTNYFPSDYQKTPDLHIHWGQKRYF